MLSRRRGVDKMLYKLSRKVAGAWESLQVEFQGQYSVDRLIALRDYSGAVGLGEISLILLLTPLPCLTMVILGDTVPLNAPEAGANSNVVFWLRSILVLGSFTLSFAIQFKEILARLPMSWRRLYFMSAVVTGGGLAYSYLLCLMIGFPLPFAMPMTAPVWSTLFLSAFAMSWWKHVRGNKEVQAYIIEWLMVFSIQTSLIGIYPFFNYGFLSLQSWPKSQAAFSLLLQVIKVAAKNAISRCMRAQSDMKPEVIIFNVEVFNALFVSFCMQNASSQLTMAAIMTVDFLHMGVSVWEINLMVREVREMGHLLDSRSSEAAQNHQPTSKNSLKNYSMLHRASDIAIRHNTSCRRVAEITRQQHTLVLQSLLCCISRSNQIGPAKNSNTIKVAQVSTTPIIPNAGVPAALPMHPPPKRPLIVEISDQSVEALEQMYGKKVAKLLYVTECTILVEYTEVIVPIVYSIYLVAMSYLPNRIYYPELKDMDSDRLHQTLINVLLYSLLELISLVVLDVVLRRLVHFSPVSQLAFVLKTQWRMVQAKLVLWVIYVVQSSLVHFGADYSFKFAWLRDPPTI